MSPDRIRITCGKRQVEPGWGQPNKPQTLHTVTINDREVLDTRNAAFASAFHKGATARAAGKPANHNPYPDYRTDRGSVTFSRAFARYWQDGWEAADHALRDRAP